LGKGITEGECESCNEMYNVENFDENGNYFLYLSMEDQIKDLLQNEKVKNISPTVIIEAALLVPFQT
jgi:hypothetical protein